MAKPIDLRFHREKIIPFYCMVFFFLMKPYIFNVIPVLDFFVNSGKLLIFVFLCWEWIKGKNHSSFSYMVLAMSTVILISTLYNQGSVYRAFSCAIPMLGASFFLDKYITDYQHIIYNFHMMAIIFLVLNVLSILVIGGGGEELTIYFLGSKNSLTIIIPLYLLIHLLYSAIYRKDKRYSFYTLIVLSILLTKSTTMLVEIVTFFCLYFFVKGRKLKKLFGYWFFWIVYIIGNISAFFLINLESLSGLIESNLEKGTDSMRVRIFMWVNALDVWREHFWLGIGKYNDSQFFHYFVDIENYKAQIHNQIFEFVTLGGVILLILYFLFCILIGRKLSGIGNTNLGYAATISCFLAYISVITSAIYNAEFFFIFGFAYYIRYIVTSNKLLMKK